MPKIRGVGCEAPLDKSAGPCICIDAHGTTRRDPRRTSFGSRHHEATTEIETNHVLPQRASALGGDVDTSRRSRTFDGTIQSLVESPPHVALFGVSADTRLAHVNGALGSSEGDTYEVQETDGALLRACLAPQPIGGDGCPAVVTLNTAARSSQTRSWMTPIKSLDALTLEEAHRYLKSANGDELAAAYALAKDRNLLDGSKGEPDEAEVHHSMFLLRRARGESAPSFDSMRIQLRRLIAA